MGLTNARIIHIRNHLNVTESLGGTISSPFLQMSKLRSREVRGTHSKFHKHVNPGSLSPEPIFLTTAPHTHPSAEVRGKE